MKTGKSLQDLAAEIDRQSKAKRDFIAPTTEIAVIPEASGPVLAMAGATYPIGDVAHEQIAEHVRIPKPYYDRMRAEAPDLLATNVDLWFRKYPAQRMIRTLDGRVRAFLSNSYRPLDNYQFAEAVLPVLYQRRLDVVSCEVTEKRLYIKAVDESIHRDVPTGRKMGDGSHTIFDTLAPAIILSNSEIGFGRLVLETGTLTKACTNLAFWSDGGMKKTHLGARHKLVDSAQNIDHLLSDQTRQKTDEALWLQVRDVLAAAFDEKRFDQRCERLATAAEQRIEGKVEKVVEVTAKRFGFGEIEHDSILRHLIEGGSLSQYGLHAAVTRTAEDLASYDRATELEYAGGQIIELPRSQWRELAEAA